MSKKISKNKWVNTLQASLVALMVGAGPAFADGSGSEQTFQLNIPAKPLADALVDFSKSTNIAVLTADIGNKLERLNSRKLSGQYDAAEALEALLSGYGLEYEFKSDETIIIRPIGSSARVQQASFKAIGFNTTADYEANLSAYEDDESMDESTAFELDEIIVTASRRSQKLQDVAMSMASVDPEKFIATGLTSIEDVIDYTPGVNFNTDGSAGSGNISVRSVTQSGPIAVTAIYIDDVPVTSSTPFAFGGDLFLDGLMDDLERVEIIKGPQGTLYGASSMGGIIRYISKNPALEETRGRASVDISSTKEGGITQLYRAMVSTPIVEDKIGFTVSGFYNDQAGFIDRLDPTTLALAEEDYNTAEIYGMSAAAFVKFSEATSLKLSAMYQTTKSRGNDLVRFTVANPDNIVLVPENGKFEVADVEPGSREIEYKKADMTFKHAFDWGEFVSVTGYAKYSNPERSDLITGNEALADFIAGSPPGTSTGLPLISAAESEKFIQEFRLSSANNDTFEWQTGLFYTKDKTDNVQSLIVEPQGVVLTDVSFPSEYVEKAAFANVTYYLTPDFDVTAGLRYSDTSLDANFNFAGLLVDAFVANPSVDDDVLTYLFNARWRVQEDMSLYARIASGYRPAWVNVPILDVVTGQASSSVVNSDSLWSYEVGAKGSLLDGKFTYDVALWAMTWDDFQASIELNGLSTGGNAGVSQSSHGLEGTFNALLTDQLRVQATAAYTKSKIDEDSVGLSAAADERTPSLPKWTASLQATYDYTIGSDIDAAVGFGVRYVGKYNTDYLGDASRGIGFGLTRQFPIEEVVLADLNANFTKDNFTLTLYATNLFNNYTFGTGGVSLDGFGNTSAGASVVTPRTIGASLGFAF